MTLEAFLAEWHNECPTVLVQTSGSTGVPKAMRVEKRRMEASAQTTCDFLGLKEGDTALLCMSLDYIAGKMMVVRSLVRGLRLVAVPPTGLPVWDEPIDFAAMVPMQVWNLIHDDMGVKRLRDIRHLIIGGGAIDDALAAELRDFPGTVWSTYGMTETLSHIALRRLNGTEGTDWYTPLSGVSLSLTPEGCLVVDAPAVHDGILVTNDIAEFAPADTGTHPQAFHILGRRDNTICSGGIKIQIEEVERRLRPHFKEQFLITKRSDVKFGEAVVLLTEGDPIQAKSVCREALPKYWQPRTYIHVDRIPLTDTCKPARKQAELLLEDYLRNTK